MTATRRKCSQRFSLFWNICRSHSLVSSVSEHPELQTSLVVQNLRKVWEFRESKATAERDPGLDWSFKLRDIILTAIDIIADGGNPVKEELLPLVTKGMELFLRIVSLLFGNQSDHRTDSESCRRNSSRRWRKYAER